MTRPAAFFDVDGTILRGNIVKYYARLRMLGQPPLVRVLWAAQFLLRIPYYLVLDKLSRRRFAAALYRNYRWLHPSDFYDRLDDLYRLYLQPELFPQAVDQIQWHRDQQHKVVFVTGSLVPIVEPVAALLEADSLIGCRLMERGGVFSGELEGGPLTDRDKAAAVASFAKTHQLDLSRCYGYADSMDDIPMLEEVGLPAVVNPGRKLERIARGRNWKVLNWAVATGHRESERPAPAAD